jgi:hypothetical protein
MVVSRDKNFRQNRANKKEMPQKKWNNDFANIVDRYSNYGK